MDYLDKKYLNYLEEVIILEAEIINSGDSDPINKTLLFYINLFKNMIIKELGISEIEVLSTNTTYEITESKSLEIYS